MLPIATSCPILSKTILILSLFFIFDLIYLHNSLSVKAESTDNSTNNQTSVISQLQISTDKQTYKVGETVNITVTNNGKESLAFPNANLGLIIKDTFDFDGPRVITMLEPSQSQTFQWDQKDSSGNQVKPGEYIVTSTSIPFDNMTVMSSEKKFTII